MLKSPHQGQFVKLHMTWDERDQNDQPLDRHTLSGLVAQLLQVWYIVDGQTTSWQYDSLGNRIIESQTRATGVQTNYSYYANSSRIKEAGTWKFDYDANGNMTSRGTDGTSDATTGQFDWDSTQGEVWQYAYDLKDRLVSVRHGLTGTASLQAVASTAMICATCASRPLSLRRLPIPSTTSRANSCGMTMGLQRQSISRLLARFGPRYGQAAKSVRSRRPYRP